MRVAQLSLVPTTGTEVPAIAPVTIERGELRQRDADILDIFEFWKGLLSNARSRLDANRKKKINERLRDGYSVEDVKLAIIGCALSDWHRGANDRGARYQDIDLICRDARHLDKFLEIADREGRRIQAEREKRASEAERAAREGTPNEDAIAQFHDILDKLRRHNCR